MDIDVVPVNQNFKGMSYGDWAIIWDNWLISENPDLKVRKDILFLRGNLDYKPVGSKGDSPRFMDPKSILDRTGNAGETIFRNTAIFIPVLTARYSFGDIYDGTRIDNEVQLRLAVNKDSDESLKTWGIVINLQEKKVYRVVDDISKFRVESPLYTLNVPSKSKLRKKTELGSKVGRYDSIIGGFFLLIKSMPPGRYRFIFGGEGRGRYSTSSIYDITVKAKRRCAVKDVSHRIHTILKQPDLY